MYLYFDGHLDKAHVNLPAFSDLVAADERDVRLPWRGGRCCTQQMKPTDSA